MAQLNSGLSSSALYQQSGDLVISVDWSSESTGVGSDPIGRRQQVAARIPDIGRATFDALRELGVDPGISVGIGHSFGNGVLEEVSRINEQTGTHRALLGHHALNPPDPVGGWTFVPRANITYTYRTPNIADDPTARAAVEQRSVRNLIVSSSGGHSSGLELFAAMFSRGLASGSRQLLNFADRGLNDQLRSAASGFHGTISLTGSEYSISSPPAEKSSPWLRRLLDWMVGDEAPLDALDVPVVQSFDPNDIIGPAGSGEERWVPGTEDLTYTVRFENLATATAPAQEVFIVQQLDPDLDPESFRLGSISFADQWIDMPDDRRALRTMVDLTATRGLLVRVLAELNLATGTVVWMLESVDPATGLLPDDPLRGIVPPNRTPPAGEGSVSYSVRPRAGSSSGSTIDAAASITFDLNAPIATPPIFNTIDSDPPMSRLAALRSASTARVVLTLASASDVGSGMSRTAIYASQDGGPFLQVASIPADQETAVFDDAALFSTYRFRTRAIDRAGNVQSWSEADDLVFTKVYDFLPDGRLDAEDYFALLNAYVEGDLRADVDRDGTLNAGDLIEFVEAVF
jgi:hypothetical protein